MLRPIKHPHLLPRIIPFRTETAATAPTITTTFGFNSYGSPGSLVRNSAVGEVLATFKRNFARLPIMIGGIGASGALGAYCSLKQVTTKTTGVLQHRSAAGTANTAESVFHGLAFGWDSSQTMLVNPQAVHQPKRGGYLTGFKINTAGETLTEVAPIGFNQLASFVKNGDGDVTLYFKHPYGMAPVVIPIGFNADDDVRAPRIHSVTNQYVRIQIGDEVPAAAEGECYLLIYGARTTHDYDIARAELDGTQRKASILAARITVTAGTPAVSIGDSTITDNGAGDFTLTFKKPFKREPIIGASATAHRVQVKACTPSSVRLSSLTGPGVLADPGHIDVITLGSFDPYIF